MEIRIAVGAEIIQSQLAVIIVIGARSGWLLHARFSSSKLVLACHADRIAERASCAPRPWSCLNRRKICAGPSLDPSRREMARSAAHDWLRLMQAPHHCSCFESFNSLDPFSRLHSFRFKVLLQCIIRVERNIRARPFVHCADTNEGKLWRRMRPINFPTAHLGMFEHWLPNHAGSNRQKVIDQLSTASSPSFVSLDLVPIQSLPREAQLSLPYITPEHRSPNPCGTSFTSSHSDSLPSPSGPLKLTSMSLSIKIPDKPLYSEPS
jgi:hypothetical protein